MRKNIFAVLAFVLLPALAQGRDDAFRFLDLPVSSHAAALGGKCVSMADDDVNFAFANPSLLTQGTVGSLALNATPYIAGVTYGTAAYAFALDSLNMMAVGAHFVNYGKFVERLETGERVGTFSANDVALYAMYARRLSARWTVGASFKPVMSSYESYFSFALAFDFGASYVNAEKKFSAGIAFRNIGSQLKGYYKDGSAQHMEMLPFSIDIGFTQRLSHAPFRFSVTMQNLQKWKNYADYATLSDDGRTLERKKITFGDNVLRHFLVGVELVPSDNFYISIGYNHRRKRELKVFENKMLNGFSAGFGLKVSKFDVGFSVAKYLARNMSYNISLKTNLGRFNRRL